MPLPRPIATIPYKNNIDERIPPYAVLQFSSDAESTDKYISVKVTKPDGTGKHFAIDNGKGAMESSDDKYCYGECIKAFIGTFWAHYVSATPPATAWDTEVGPVSGEWYVNDTGTGFVYAGVHDPDNQRIMVMQTASGGGVGGKIWFKVVSISDYYWEVPGCEYIRAEVTQKSCSANVAIGDIVYIFDPFFCWFNLPIAIMMRISGTATFAENAYWDGVTPLVCGVTPGKCFWSVDGVCCLEEEDYGSI